MSSGSLHSNSKLTLGKLLLHCCSHATDEGRGSGGHVFWTLHVKCSLRSSENHRAQDSRAHI